MVERRLLSCLVMLVSCWRVSQSNVTVVVRFLGYSKESREETMARANQFGYPVGYMAAGWAGSEGDAPGFPKDGSWIVKHEGMLKGL